METEMRVDDLVDRWEEMRDHGSPLTIDELCAGSPELVAEVRRRIETLQAVDSALDTEVREPRSTAADRDRPGAGLYRGLPEVLRATAVYRQGRHHDHGGLGVVFTAHQEELDRTVALKRIRPDRLHDVARRRFLREAALTAGLQHPGIVPIYGLGQDDGGPFYTMPFIEGQTVQEAIDAFHGDDSLRRDPGRRSLRFRGLLQHFITACNTMAYAHDQGVVHRDLKPSNLMLGRYGETLVMDWGLAKRFGADDAASAAEGDGPSPSPGSEDVTATGEILGTPQYMSPEQAKGEPASPAGDIFTLGLVLYAILTGKSAFEQSSFRGPDRLMAVREAAIVPPRSRDPRVPRALEAICLKALAARPLERYASARALADDVMRWLADEPVMAWREPVSIRARRWVRHHRALVTSTAAVLVLSLAGLAGFTTVLTGKNRELDAKNVVLTDKNRQLDAKNVELANKNQELDKQRQRAEQREALAIDAVKKFRDAVHTNPGLKNHPELDALRKALLKEPMEFFRKLRDQLEADRDTRPDVLHKLAEANFDLSNTTRELGSFPDAIRSLSESIAILERLDRDQPAVAKYQRELAQSYTNMGNMLTNTGQPPEALESFRRAVAIQERLARDNPTDTMYQGQLAVTHNNIGGLLSDAGDPAEALESHRKAARIRERLARVNSSDAQFQNPLAQSHYNIGNLLAEMGRPAEALESSRKAVEIRERLVRDYPTVTEYQSDLGFSLNAIGALLTDKGDNVEALEPLRRALAIRERLVADHPTVTQYQRDLAFTQYNIGRLLSGTGHPAEALESFRKAVEVFGRLAGDNLTVAWYQSNLAETLNRIGVLLKETGHPTEALESYQRALAIQDRLARHAPSVHRFQSALGNMLSNIAEIEMGQRRWREAREHLERAIERQRAALAVMPLNRYYRETLCTHLVNLAKVCQELNLPAEADRVAVEAARVAREDAELERGNPFKLYNIACTLALSVPFTRGEQQQQALAAEAVQTLKKAIAAGWSDAMHTSRDPDLAPLHDRQDFRRLLADLFDRGFPENPFAP